MGCSNSTTHEFAEGATTCQCGKTRTVERTVMEPPPVRCFVCGGPLNSGKLAIRYSERGVRHQTCNPARVCKCGALAPEGKIWSPFHGCSVDGPCAIHSVSACCIPDPLYKPKPRTFTVAEVKGMDEEALMRACERHVVAGGIMPYIPNRIDWDFAMRCRDEAVRRTRRGTVAHCLSVLERGGWLIEAATPADFARAALLAVAGEGVK